MSDVFIKYMRPVRNAVVHIAAEQRDSERRDVARAEKYKRKAYKLITRKEVV